MKKTGAIFASLIILSCVNTGSVVDGTSVATNINDQLIPAGYFVTIPNQNSINIIGVSGSMQKRETEINNALEDAARKASMFHGMSVYYEITQSTGSGFFDYQNISSLIIDYDKQLESYMEKLKYDPECDILTEDNVVYIRFTYPVNFPNQITYSFSKNINGSPEWVTTRPKSIDGFITGIGYSARQFRRQDTFVRSYESAIAELVSNLSTVVSIKNIAIGNRHVTETETHSSGNLKNFIIMEIWVDPDTLAVWTLAIAQGK